MHPRSVYNTEPDFAKLAEEYEEFKKYVTINSVGRGRIDFKDPHAVKELTVSLLKKDFKLDVDFPLDSLCPAVPNRLNYTLWLEDLLDDTLTAEAEKNIIGIDIGVGASCIYPLLGCASNSNWKFLGTDIDERSIKYAKENVDRNNLQDRIIVQHNPDPNKIFILDDDVPVYTFSMCNPPFYNSQEELDQGLLNKELEPSAICTGSNNEMITEGGEYGFISRMVEESLLLKERIIWYTSMIGLKKTIRPLVRLLTDAGITNYVVTQFAQGKTYRWAIAWSFYQDRRPTTIKVIETWSPKYRFEAQLPKSTDVVEGFVKEILDDLDIQYKAETNDVDEIILDCSVEKNTWSRAARRQRKRQKLDPSTTVAEEQAKEETPTPFIFSLELSPGKGLNSYLQIVWHKGRDRAMFEGFWSHLKKRVEENCGILRGSTFAAPKKQQE